MLETADLSLTLSREDYDARRPNYDREIFDLARRAKAGGVPVVIVFEGTELAGKGKSIYDLTEKLDPRVATVHATGPARKYERERPWLWRFWMKLPGKGEIGIFDESWYRRVLLERVERTVRKREWHAAYGEISELEHALVNDGTVVIKFFMHIDAATQRRRMLRARRQGQKVQGAWRRQNERFHEWERTVEDMLERTHSAAAPWTIVPSRSGRFARAKVFETVIAELGRALEARGIPRLPGPVAAAAPIKDSLAAHTQHAVDAVRS